MPVVGVVSDTHGLLRPEAVDLLRGSDLIIHAGDVEGPKVLPALRKLAPVVAVRGNVDRGVGAWVRKLPEFAVAEIGGLHLYVLHQIDHLDLDPAAAGFAAVIYGHSHKPAHEVRHGVLYFNPGSAGPRRFSLPISVGRLHVNAGQITPELIRIG